MPTPTIPTSITDFDPIAANNSPKGSDDTGGAIDDLFRAHASIIRKQFSIAESINVASELPIPAEGSYVKVSGSGSVLTLSDCFPGRTVTLLFSAGVTLTHSASLILPGGADIVTQADDTLMFVNEEAGVWRCLAGWKMDSGKNLLKASNLADLPNKATARSNLGLGTAATETAQTSAIDYTPNSLMRVGAFGLGGYMYSKATSSGEPTGAYYDPDGTWGGGSFFFNVPYASGGGFRISNIPYQDRFFMHSSQGTGMSLRTGVELYHTNNKPTWGDVQGKPSTFPPTTTGVAVAVASLSVGAVGTYALLTDMSTDASRAPGEAVAGSSLRYSNTYSDLGTAPPGSWRLMGMTTAASSRDRHTSLWLRYV